MVWNLGKKELYQKYVWVFDDQENGWNNKTLGIPNSMRYKDSVWIPHRPFVKNKDTSTTKICRVFSCSFKTGNSVSVNDAGYPEVNFTLLFGTNEYVPLESIPDDPSGKQFEQD